MNDTPGSQPEGFWENLRASIAGVATGGVLFITSFVILWVNEGRVDLSQIARKSTQIQSAAVDAASEGKFVSVTGPLTVAGKLGDAPYLLPGDYVSLDRQVQMYSWVERRPTQTGKQKSVQQSPPPVYDRSWSSKPERPDRFIIPVGHENPSLTIDDRQARADKAQVGAYAFSPAAAALPSGTPLRLSDAMLAPSETAVAPPVPDSPLDKAQEPPATPDTAAPADPDSTSKKSSSKKKRRSGRSRLRRSVLSPSTTSQQARVDRAQDRAAAIAASKPAEFVLASDEYLFRGTGTLESPRIGDVRIRYRALAPGGTVTVFGKLQAGELHPYVSDGISLLQVLPGSREEALLSMSDSHKRTTWILRVLGILMMWFGLTAFFGPINAILDVIPFLGSAGRVLIGIAMFPVALVLSLATMLLSIVFHSLVLLLLLLAALAAAGYLAYRRRAK